MADWLASAHIKQLKESIQALLASSSDDHRVIERLQDMLPNPYLEVLSWYWAPLLYARNRIVFRAFIQQHFTERFTDPASSEPGDPLPWQAEVAASLDPWLLQLEQDDEFALFRRVFIWKHRHPQGRGLNPAAWRRDLLEKFGSGSAARRARLLQLYDMPAQLDEFAALTLYERDPLATIAFILKHLPQRWWGEPTQRRLWSQLAERARHNGHHDFYFKLYRRQIPLDEWSRETLALCTSIANPGTLNIALEERHPQGHWDSLAAHFHKLLEARGLDVLPYIRKHLRTVFRYGRRSGYDDLVRLARQHQWTQLWVGMVVICGGADHYNTAIRQVLEDDALADAERLYRLSLLSGVSPEWNATGWGKAAVQPLDGSNALAMYRRYPSLLRQTFKTHVTPTWHEPYFDLFELVWRNDDEDLIDHLASRYAIQAYYSNKLKAGIDELVAQKYLGLGLDQAAFARRAANVLTRIPAAAIDDYAGLLRENRLAQLLFARSIDNSLQDAGIVRDLAEADAVHVQLLAYRMLALDHARAREQARANLDTLTAALLRPMRRLVRLAAFAALDNAASSAACAATVLARARAALSMPEQRYPREPLIGLIARILARYPQLAAPVERPVIFRRRVDSTAL